MSIEDGGEPPNNRIELMRRRSSVLSERHPDAVDR